MQDIWKQHYQILVGTSADELYLKANSVPGGKSDERAPVYKQIQKILHDDVVYVFLFGNMSAIGYSDKFLGVQPGP